MLANKSSLDPIINMKRTILTLAALLLAPLAAHTSDLPNTASAGTQEKPTAGSADARRDLLLKDALAHKLSDSMGMLQVVPLALARYWLNQDTAAADRAIIRAASPELPGVVSAKDEGSEEDGHYYLQCYLVQRVYFLFNSRSEYFSARMSKAAEDAVAKSMWDWASVACKKKMVAPEHIGWLAGTENLAGRVWASFWGAAQILAEHPDYRDRKYADGTPVQEMARAFDDYYKLFTRERAAKGLMVEVNSGYNDWTLDAWYNIADFSRDPLTRQRMKMFLDLWWADWAIEQIDGVRGGSRHRCYPGGNSQEGPGAGGEAAWYLFGVGQPARALGPKYVGPATTFYRPSPIVTDLLRAPDRGTYAYFSRRLGLGTTKYAGKEKANKPTDAYDGTILAPDDGNLLRYTFCTPDFVMGTSMVPALPLEDWTLISCQNRWEGVIFAGHRSARIFVQPEATDGKHYYNASWSVQNKGVMIVQRLRSSRKAQGQRVWLDASLKREEQGGWVFAEAPQAYAAVRIVEGGSRWESDPAKKGRGGNGMWLRCVNEFSPVILEVAKKSDYSDLAAFQKAILANSMKWKNNTLDYESSLYTTKLTFHADYSKVPEVDGVPVNYNPKKVYDSPFIQGDFDSGVVTIQKGDRKMIVDFNKTTVTDHER